MSSFLHAAGRFGACGGGLTISRTAGLVGGSELIFLLVDDIPAPIHPVFGLFPGFAGLGADSFFSFLSFGEKHVTRLFPGAWCVQHADYGADSETRQKPHKSIAVTIRHRLLLYLFPLAWMVAPGYVKDNFTVLLCESDRTLSWASRPKAGGGHGGCFISVPIWKSRRFLSQGFVSDITDRIPCLRLFSEKPGDSWPRRVERLV